MNLSKNFKIVLTFRIMIKIIDCDVHPYVQSVKDLYNYMDPAVVKKFEIAGVEISTGLDTILTRKP